MKLSIDQIQSEYLQIFVSGRELCLSAESSSDNPKILDIIGNRNQTDKGSNHHNYLHFYERFLSPFRDQPISLLEIGVGNGASLKMWRDYFNQAKITGMDINNGTTQYAEGRISIEIGDQKDEQALKKVASLHGPFHVVIDDAGHDPEAQIFSYETLQPFVRSGGLYILEDIMDDRVVNFLCDISKKIVKDTEQLYDSISFFKGTSITRYR